MFVHVGSTKSNTNLSSLASVISPTGERVQLIRRLIQRERAAELGTALSWSKRWQLWRWGFLSRAEVIYDFDRWDPSDYLTDIQRERTNRINWNWGIATQNKLLFLKRLPDKFHPRIHAVIDNGTIVPFDTTARPQRIDGFSAQFTLLREAGRLVVKPVYGYRGQRVTVLTHTDGRYYRNKTPIGESALREWLQTLNQYFVTEFLRQHEFVSTMYSEAKNTLRLLTMWPDNGAPFDAAGAFRIGTAASAPLDNWSQGGIATRVDLETGSLDPAIGIREGQRRTLSRHPDTDRQIADRTVPRWGEIKEGVLALATRFPEVPYLGWDIALTEGLPFGVIEANAFPDADVVQLHRPLLIAPEGREFYEAHNVI